MYVGNGWQRESTMIHIMYSVRGKKLLGFHRKRNHQPSTPWLSINPHSGTASYLLEPRVHPLPFSIPFRYLPYLFGFSVFFPRHLQCLIQPFTFSSPPFPTQTLPSYGYQRISTKQPKLLPYSRAFVHSSFRPKLITLSASENKFTCTGRFPGKTKRTTNSPPSNSPRSNGNHPTNPNANTKFTSPTSVLSIHD